MGMENLIETCIISRSISSHDVELPFDMYLIKMIYLVFNTREN